ncbi:MAG: dihydrodipicolinate synthase family protein [Thermomicrobiales bacterium]
MNRDELKRLIQGPIATLPTAFDEAFNVDLGVMAELSAWWVANGLTADRTPLKVAAAMGEGPDLSDDEWPRVLRTVVDAAGSQAAVVCALKPKNTLHTIEDAKRAQDLGAIGLQIDLPIFHHPTQDDLLRFFADISDAVDIGIMIYNTFWFGTESMAAETMLRLADAEHVVAIKWAVPEGQDYDDMRRFAHIFNVIDNSNQPIRCHKNGGRGYIDPTTAVYPRHALTVWDLLEAGRYDEVEALQQSVNNPLAPFRAKTTRRSGGYRQLKGMMAAMGRPVGPPRPPTLPLDEGELAELADILAGIGWPVASTPAPVS